MKERIEELARQCGMLSMANLDYRGSIGNMTLPEKDGYLRDMKFANAVFNEALEMAAKECERLRDSCTMHSDGGVCYEQACDDCDAAIRKLKVT